MPHRTCVFGNSTQDLFLTTNFCLNAAAAAIKLVSTASRNKQADVEYHLLWGLFSSIKIENT